MKISPKAQYGVTANNRDPRKIRNKTAEVKTPKLIKNFEALRPWSLKREKRTCILLVTPSKKKYYENFLLATKKVLMKTVV